MPISKKPRSKPAAKAKTSPKASAPAALPDRRAMESFLAAISGRRGDDATAKAQDVMYEAWERNTSRSRIALARKALGISPLCADAYVLLAEEAQSIEEARDLYTKGVEAGELALGPQGFEEYAGHFWGFLETRPYMRARAGLASTLVQLGDIEGALTHYRDMLELNPNGNQGIRSPGACLSKTITARLKSCSLRMKTAVRSGSIPGRSWPFARATRRPQRWSRMPGQRTSMCLPSWPARSRRSDQMMATSQWGARTRRRTTSPNAARRGIARQVRSRG